ncbi:MAG TPA: pilus assembly protein TadG-related protein [Nocardioides sp.]|nr:pilus assembly protein TadG-related protein [Nocardioides sp.]
MHRPLRRREERGAAAVIMGVGLTMVLVLIAAFAVDLGMQRTARRDMQALADVVALDLARHLDGRTRTQLAPTMDAAMARSVARNSDTIGDAPDLVWDLGTMQGGDFVPVGAEGVPTAVEVRAGTSVDFAFGGVTGVASGDAGRRAVAESVESACFRIGSFIASLDSAQGTLLNPLLGGLLGSTLNLDLISYQGLAGANVSLLELVEVGGLGVGTVEELLHLDGVAVADLFVAAARVLDSQGKLAEANVLRSLQVAAGTPSISIADIVDAGPSDAAALDASVNVLDLVTGAAMVANQSHAIEIPNLGITLPGLVSTTTTLTVVEPAQTRCGRKGTVNETAQVRLRITGSIPAKTINVSILGLANVGVLLDPTQVTVDIDLGRAIAELRAVSCNELGPDSIRVGLSSAVVGGISVRATLGAHLSVSVPLTGSGGLLSQVLSLLGLGSLLNPPEIKLDTGLTVTASSPAASTFDKDVTVPLPGGYTTPVGSGSGIILGPTGAQTSGTTKMTVHYGLLGTQTKAVVDADGLYGTVLNPVLSGVAASLNPLLTALQGAVITPLSDLLGLQLGGADVFGVPTPTCNGVRLVG